MSVVLSLIIENGSFVAIFLISLFGAYVSFKSYKTLPGADLVSVGFLLYAVYALLAFTGPGFTGSYFNDFSGIGRFDSSSLTHLISCTSRLGLILVVIGLFRIGRRLKT
ncbi:MAG: hypothetical protein JSV16_16675 [Candidatus Hydrogenedentota bacterium]|nr:MAG: hypothetical protein JSV16_16675 [Candidatus Hydrogenedentota bacterium]